MSADKSKKSVKKVEPVAAPVVVAPVVVAPVAEKKATKAKAPKAAAPPTKVEATVPTVATVVEAPEQATLPAQERLSAVVEKLKDAQSKFNTEIKEITKEAMSAVKAAGREIKDAKKRKRSKKPEDMTPEEKKAWEARRANNAFLKPRLLTPELCTFMGLPHNSLRSQTDVTKFVATYVKSHNCFDPANKRRIIPDAVLAKLLKCTDKDTVTYLNLQSYLKNHFVKTA
jgi:chromatin remodeling complex protein RSC6